MSDKPNTLRTLQATSIFLASTAAGGNLGLSFFLIPRLLESPTPLMLRQWATSFHITKKIFPLMGTAAAITNFFLAYAFRRANVAAGGVVGGISTKSRLYLAAGVLCFGMVPYTVALLLPINTKLLRKVRISCPAFSLLLFL